MRDEGVALTGEQPNIDFALASICDTFGLASKAPFVIFALARCPVDYPGDNRSAEINRRDK